MGRNDDVREHFSILQIARRMKQTSIIIRSNVDLVAFAGKERGSLGSKVYAIQLLRGDMAHRRHLCYLRSWIHRRVNR
ncbi:hypothetical protein EV401DRAFT_2027735 [Pisolithus croceorrhizus]|nr:hypothetical protein EV401DRAFT_2027735 [Pisolithus croceorrhizus]